MQELCSRYRCSPGTQCVFRAGEGFGCTYSHRPADSRLRNAGPASQHAVHAELSAENARRVWGEMQFLLKSFG